MSELQPEGQPQPAEAQPEVEYAQIPVEQWEQTQQLLEQVGPLLEYVNQAQSEQMQQPQQQQPQMPDFNYDDPVASVMEIVNATLDQRVAPIESYTHEQQLQEANEQARDILNDYLSEQQKAFLGDEQQQNYAAEQVLRAANHYVFEEAERFGPGVEAAEAAIKRAVDEELAYQAALGSAAHEQQVQQVRNVLQAPQQPQTAGSQAAQTLVAPSGGPRAVFEKYYGGGG